MFLLTAVRYRDLTAVSDIVYAKTTMAASRYFHSVDIGTTKTNSTIVEVDEDGNLHVVGFATVPSFGLRNSLVISMEKATSAIYNAAYKSQMMAGVKVKDVIIGIAGEHIKSFNNKGMISVSKDRNSYGSSSAVTPNDINRVIEDAKAVTMPVEFKILDAIAQEYTVDDLSDIKNPLGLTCRHLEAEVHVITGAITIIKNIQHCVRKAGLEIRELVPESIASGYAVLTEDEMNQGVVLIDIGGGTCGVGLYYKGSIRCTMEMKYAGAFVTDYISELFRIPFRIAEKIKINYGSVLSTNGDSDEIPVDMLDNNGSYYIDSNDLNLVIYARMKDIFERILYRIRHEDCFEQLTKVVITGGGSQLKDVRLLAENIFKLPARIGIPRGIKGMEEKINNPACATGIGLILWSASKQSMNRFNNSEALSLKRIITSLKKFFTWIIN